MAENLQETIDVTANRLKVLSEAQEKLNKKYQEGKISADAYQKSLKVINDEQDKLKGNVSETTDSINDTSSKMKEYTSSVEKYGATLNTTLSIISASVSKTNPGLATAIGSVQKLIPNMTECMNAFQKVSENADKAGVKMTKFGKLMKVATSPAGIMLLITAITTLITSWDKIAESVGVSSEKIEAFREKANNVINAVIKGVVGVGNAIVKFVNTPFKTLIDVIKKVFKGDFKGAAEDIRNSIKEQFSFKKHFQEGFESDFANGIATVGKSKKVEDAATETGKKIGTDISDAVAKALSFTGTAQEAAKKALDDFQAFWNEYTKKFELKNPLSQLDESEVEDDDAFLKGIKEAEEEKKRKEKEAEEAEQMQYDARIDNYKTFLDSYTKLSNTITDGISKNLEAELNAGKISEKEYKRKKKVLQGFTIASIVASAASGLVDTWAAYSADKKANKYPEPARTALNTKYLISAIAQSALLTATAASSIGSVRSESLSGSTPTASASAAPSISYISNPSYQESVDAAKETASNTGQSNVVPVLVVDDVNKVQNDMSVVQTNSSF